MSLENEVVDKYERKHARSDRSAATSRAQEARPKKQIDTIVACQFANEHFRLMQPSAL
jgi:hypothetical protein